QSRSAQQRRQHSHASSVLLSYEGPPATEFYPLSLHDALPICSERTAQQGSRWARTGANGTRARRNSRGSCLRPLPGRGRIGAEQDRKSTRLNSSHVKSSYAVLCLKTKTPPEHGALARAATSGG